MTWMTWTILHPSTRPSATPVSVIMPPGIGIIMLATLRSDVRAITLNPSNSKASSSARQEYLSSFIQVYSCMILLTSMPLPTSQMMRTSQKVEQSIEIVDLAALDLDRHKEISGLRIHREELCTPNFGGIIVLLASL